MLWIEIWFSSRWCIWNVINLSSFSCNVTTLSYTKITCFDLLLLYVLIIFFFCSLEHVFIPHLSSLAVYNELYLLQLYSSFAEIVSIEKIIDLILYFFLYHIFQAKDSEIVKYCNIFLQNSFMSNDWFFFLTLRISLGLC